MRVPEMVRDFFDWRWAPCVGLTTGSLAFVALALLLIPTRFGSEVRDAATLSSFANAGPREARYASSLSASRPESERQHEDFRVARTAPPSGPRTSEARAPLQRGFSPILERPERLEPPAHAPPQPVAALALPPVAALVAAPVPSPVAAPAPPPVAASVPAPAPTVEPLVPGSVVVPPVPAGESRSVAVP